MPTSSWCRTAIVLLLGLPPIASATQIIDDDPIDKSGPNVDQIAHDLVGSKFLYSVSGAAAKLGDSAGSRVWTVRKNDLKRLEILARFQSVKKGDYVNRIDEVQARVTLANRAETIRGPLVFLYMQMGEKWQMVYAGPRDGNRYNAFSFERNTATSGKLIAGLSPPDTATGPSPYAPAEVSAPWDTVGSRVVQATVASNLNDPAGPPVEMIRRDMVGHNFTYFVRGADSGSKSSYMTGTWRTEPGEIENINIIARYPSVTTPFRDTVYELQALVTLSDCTETIRGILAFQYMKGRDGWRLWGWGARDGDRKHDFSFERTRRVDGKRTAHMIPANAPDGPWRFAPKPMISAPGPDSGTVIQAF